VAATSLHADASAPVNSSGSPLEVLLAFSRLGLTSFGGPVAHLGYFRAEFVERRRWLDDRAYADLVGLCQFLPGPASSQVGIGIGLMRAGVPGALAAWTGFTLPSALLMAAFGMGLNALGDPTSASWLHGLKIVAVAVVAQAVWTMARNLCPDRPRATIAVLAALLLLLWPVPIAQIGAIAFGAIAGWSVLRGDGGPALEPLAVPLPRWAAAIAIGLFVGLLVALPLLRAATGDPVLALIDSFYRPGSLVFGGGHVILPLLQAEVVPPGWVSNEQFLAGYGAAQAVPGPLTTFAAFLGASRTVRPNGPLGALIALVSVFLPSFLLVFGALPFWGAVRGRPAVAAGMRGVNAAVVGILLAALYTPVWTSAIAKPPDFALAVAALALLAVWRIPPWAVVVGSAVVAGVAGL
jgi:chromate transporter